MNKLLNEASRWRIELAQELAIHYKQHEQIKMIVLGGSPSRGLSNKYSDLDVIVYWDTSLYELIDDILALVSAHMPNIDVATTKQRMKALGVHACESKPRLQTAYE
ncbi:MAG: hypothetical protein GY805_35005 [Chloroflexi bacterium]|nr:hypothetical protein [Chloroflexota bacterium]